MVPIRGKVYLAVTDHLCEYLSRVVNENLLVSRTKSLINSISTRLIFWCYSMNI